MSPAYTTPALIAAARELSRTHSRRYAADCIRSVLLARLITFRQYCQILQALNR